MKHAARRLQYALTLVEVIAALAVAALLMTALMSALTTTVRGMVRARVAMQRTRTVSGIERVMRRDFASAFRAGEEGLPACAGRAPEEGAEVALEFFTTQSLVPSVSQAAGGLARVEYVVESSERIPGAQRLLRREMPYTAGRALDRSREAEFLADGLLHWRMEFYDGTEWKDNWRRDRLPTALRVSFSLAEPALPADREGSAASRFQATLLFTALVSPDAQALPVIMPLRAE